MHDKGDVYAFMTNHKCSKGDLSDGDDEYAMMTNNV